LLSLRRGAQGFAFQHVGELSQAIHLVSTSSEFERVARSQAHLKLGRTNCAPR
jgi:hypothetical protein